MGVITQAFYWDCPKREGKEYRRGNHVRKAPYLVTSRHHAFLQPRSCPESNTAATGDMPDLYRIDKPTPALDILNYRGPTSTFCVEEA